MELERHGLQVVLRKTDNFLPGPNGSYLLSGRDGLTRSEIARHVPADGAAYDRYHEELDTVVPLIRKWILKAPPEAGRWPSRPAAAGQPRPRPDRPVDRRNPDRPRIRDQERRRHPRSLLRGRPDQGAVRVRRHRRQFRVALYAGHRLCAAPPSVRRGSGRAGRLGPRHRRHGRDHPGDGQGLPRGRRRHRPQCPGQRDHRRKGPRGGPGFGRQELARSDRSSPASIPSCCSTGWCPRARSAARSRSISPIGAAKARRSG